jgi:hypothetical protein
MCEHTSHYLYVILQLRRDGNYGRALGHGAFDKCAYLFVLFARLLLANQVDLVLQYKQIA